MISIAQHHIFQIAFVPLVKIEMVIKLCLLNLPNVEGFVHHDETHSVGQLKRFRGRRVVRSAKPLTPIAFNISNWRSMARVLNAAPNEPRS